MEYLAGKPLAALCELGPMPIKRCVHIARQICSALGAAHDKGIVHRDLKPENVFLVERNGDPDFVKVLDFGISKMHSSGVDKGLTRTGMAMGTPSYMSPEQAQGSKAVDHRTDIWALGVILYEMLAARRPFDADSYPLLLMNIVATDPDPIAWYRKDLPPGLADLVMKCLIKDQSARVGSMRELSEGLAAFDGIDIEVELGVPDSGAPKESAEERFKATALGRKKGAATAPDGSDDGPRTTTQPDGSIEGPPPVALAHAEAEARRAKDTVREALPSEPRRASDDDAKPSRIPAPTAPEVRALESQARSGNVTTLAVAGAALVAVVGIGIAAASGAFGGSNGSTTPPSTGSAPVTPREADPPREPTKAPPETVRVEPPQPVQAPPTEVRIRIRVDPADATIHIGDVEFPNPMDAPQPRSLTPIRIRIERDGYRTIEQLAIFGEDQSFMFQMARGRGVEQRPMSGGGGGGGGSGGGTEATTTMDTSMTTMQVYEGAQGGFRDDF
jgi:serine/threonine-protein kinase